uniref:B30.2/SPRY domain-containing protein n=1 Tax=Gallus gallus TaxID=9031 RepID=A0A8V0XRH0_CHICK
NFLGPNRVEIKARRGNKFIGSTNRKNYLFIAVDVTLDADTAHPRLQVSEDGKSVTDTGVIRKVPNKDERFDSHTFLLAKEGYRSGRLYWEVDVGKKQNWNLGVAQETVRRKETVALSPKNGFWVIGLYSQGKYILTGREDVSDCKQCSVVGVLLDVESSELSFYNVEEMSPLGSVVLEFTGKLYPFFSPDSSGKWLGVLKGWEQPESVVWALFS